MVYGCSVSPNKMGIGNISDLIRMENTICKNKLSEVTSNIPFDRMSFTLEHLCRIHNYLFGDLYYDAGVIREVSDRQLVLVKRALNLLSGVIESESPSRIVDTVSQNIYRIYSAQLFCDGNTRTSFVFLGQILRYKELDFDYDFYHGESNPKDERNIREKIKMLFERKDEK